MKYRPLEWSRAVLPLRACVRICPGRAVGVLTAFIGRLPRTPGSLRLFALLFTVGLGVSGARAQGPSTRPAETRPTDAASEAQFGPPDPAKRPAVMAKWFADLASADGKVRDAAKVSLMGLEREDLPALRKLIEQRRPLLPSQAVVLKEIVSQIYLSGDTFDMVVNGREGFLGIRPVPVSVGARPPGDEPGSRPYRPPCRCSSSPAILELIPAKPAASWSWTRCPASPPPASCKTATSSSGSPSAQDPIPWHRGFQLYDPRPRGRRKSPLRRAPPGPGHPPRGHPWPAPDDAESVPGGMTRMQQLLDRRAKEVTDLWESQFAPLLDEGLG